MAHSIGLDQLHPILNSFMSPVIIFANFWSGQCVGHCNQAFDIKWWVLFLEGNHRVLRPVEIQLQVIGCVRVVGHATWFVSCGACRKRKGGGRDLRF